MMRWSRSPTEQFRSQLLPSRFFFSGVQVYVRGQIIYRTGGDIGIITRRLAHASCLPYNVLKVQNESPLHRSATRSGTRDIGLALINLKLLPLHTLYYTRLTLSPSQSERVLNQSLLPSASP